VKLAWLTVSECCCCCCCCLLADTGTSSSTHSQGANFIPPNTHDNYSLSTHNTWFPTPHTQMLRSSIHANSMTLAAPKQRSGCCAQHSTAQHSRRCALSPLRHSAVCSARTATAGCQPPQFGAVAPALTAPNCQHRRLAHLR
jgi:hypothetical protein